MIIVIISWICFIIHTEQNILLLSYVIENYILRFYGTFQEVPFRNLQV